MIYLAADHEGFVMKEYISKYFKKREIHFEDLGTYNETPVDYPKYAKRAVESVLKNNGSAILICGTGEGMAIVANRTKGIRATVAWNPEVAVLAREHNNANVLAIPARFVNNKEAEEIVSAFLSASFTHEERHVRRIKEIDEK